MTSPVEHPGSPSSITAGLLASGFAQMPFVLSRSERNDLQSLSIDRWTRRSGPGASYLPDGEEPDHAFESLSRRLLGLVRVTALELAELGALPKGIAVGGAWHSSAGSYAAAPGVRLHPHHDVEVLLLDEPTRGIDVGSRARVYALIDELALAGRAVVLCSSYLPELLGVCDRIAVMCRGRLGAETVRIGAVIESRDVSMCRNTAFANLTGNPADDWLGQGMAESLTADFAKVRGLRSISREQIFDDVYRDLCRDAG